MELNPQFDDLKNPLKQPKVWQNHINQLEEERKEATQNKGLLKVKTANEWLEQFLNIQEAAQFLNLTVPTMCSKVSNRELPCMKRGKRLYFSSTELMEYIKEGRKKSYSEIEQEAETYLSNNKKGLK